MTAFLHEYTRKIQLIIPLSSQQLTIDWRLVSELDDLLSFNISSIDLKDIVNIQVSLNETQFRGLQQRNTYQRINYLGFISYYFALLNEHLFLR